MIRKYVTFFTLFVAVFFCIGSAHAQMTEVERGNWLLGVIFKLERMRDDATSDIQKYEREIERCDSTIRKSKNIIRLAQQKGNVKAEMIARDALGKATQAKARNEELKNSAELRKKRAEIALANVRNLLANQLSVKEKIRSLVTSHTGRVYVFSKRLNESIPLGEDRAGFLEPGDEIWTLGNSSAELQFLDGRGTLKLGEYTKITMEEEGKGQQIINMLKGKIHVAVDKLDDYRKMMEEKIRAYKEDATLVRDEAMQKLVNQYEQLQGRMERARTGKTYSYSPFWPLLPGVEIRTPCAVLADRGTKFLVSEDEKTGTELIVFEGVVDVKATKGEESIPVDAGYRIRVSKDGVISKPEKIDLVKMEKWWER